MQCSKKQYKNQEGEIKKPKQVPILRNLGSFSTVFSPDWRGDEPLKRVDCYKIIFDEVHTSWRGTSILSKL